METIALTSSVSSTSCYIWRAFLIYLLLYSEVGVVHGLPQSWRNSYSCANLIRGSTGDWRGRGKDLTLSLLVTAPRPLHRSLQ